MGGSGGTIWPAERRGEHETPTDAPYRLDQRSLEQGHRDHLRDRPVLSQRAPGSQFQLPHRPQHQCGIRFHPGQPVLRAEHAHAAVVRERHAAARRRHHHQRRSGHQLGRQGRKPRRHGAGHRQLCRLDRHPPSARRRGAAGGRLFAGPGDQCRRRQPRASDPDAVRSLHAEEEEQASQEPEDRHLRRPQGQPHHPFLRLRAGALRRQHHADAGQGDGAAGARGSPAARGIRLPDRPRLEARKRRRRRSMRSM